MDPNSPLSRMERTMWTVWGYISGAVTRFLRSQPAEVTSNEQNSLKESTVDSKSSKNSHAKADTGVGEVSEEKPLATGHQPMSSLPGVAWEVCTKDDKLRSDEDDMQLKRGNESRETENTEGIKEEQLGHTGKDPAGKFIDDAKANVDAPEKTENEKFSTYRQDETPENNEEHMNVGLEGLKGDGVTEEVEKSDGESEAQERTVSAVTLDGHQKLHGTITEIQINEEKCDKDLKEENSKVKVCTFIDLRPEEEDSMLRKKVGMQELTQEEVKNCEGTLKLALEQENKPDEGTKPVQSSFSLCEDMSDVSKDEFIVAGQDASSENKKSEAERVPTVVIKKQDISEEEDINEKEVQKYISDDDDDDDDDDDEEVVEEDIFCEEKERDVEEDINDEERNEDIDKEEREEIFDNEESVAEDIDDKEEDLEEDINDKEEKDFKEDIDDKEEDVEEDIKEREKEHIEEDIKKKEDDLEEDIDDKKEKHVEEDIEDKEEKDLKEDINDKEEEDGEEDIKEKEDDVEEDIDDKKKESVAEAIKEKVDDVEEDIDDKKEKHVEEDIEDKEEKGFKEDIKYKEEEHVEEDIKDKEHDVEEDIDNKEEDVEKEMKDKEEKDFKEDINNKEEEDGEEDIKEKEDDVEEDIDDKEEEEGNINNNIEKGEEDIFDIEEDKDVEEDINSDEEAHEEVDEDINVDEAEEVKEDIYDDEKEVDKDINSDDEEDVEEDISKSTNNNTKEEDPEKNSRVDTDIWREENSLTQSDICSEEAEENTQYHKTEFTDKQEDVLVTGVQTTTETDSSLQEISEVERVVDKDQMEEEKLSSEVDNKGGCLETVCTKTPVTVNPEGETEQETSREFKNIPLRSIEGQIAVSQELNAQVCEETQEGIPDHNNELRPDENTTQWFLEKGNYEEVQITQLPEEEESKDQESFKNKAAGAHSLLLREHLKEKRVSKEESECSFDLAVEEHRGKLQLSEEDLRATAEIQESGHSFEEREEVLSESSMKTDIGSAEDTDKTAEELQDGAEVAVFRMDEDLREASGDVCETNEATAADEGVRFAGETSKVLEAEPNSLDDSAAETPDVGIDAAEGDEKEDEMQDRKERAHLQVAGMAAELITGQKDKENAESESSLHFDTEEMRSQSLHRASEMNETEIKDTEAADESKTNTPEAFPVMSAEETTGHVTQSESYHKDPRSLITEHQDVIGEDILDLWIETAMSEETLEQHISEPEPQKGPMADTQIEEPGKSEKELKELNSGESGLVNDTETSSSALKSGFLDRAFNDSECIKLTSTSSVQGIHNMLATVPEFSAPSSESQGVQMEETAETLPSYFKDVETVCKNGSDPDSGVSLPEEKHPDQESGKLNEKPDEGPEAEMEVTVRACGDTEEAHFGSQIQMNPLFQVEIKNFEDEPLEATASDSSDEPELTESGQPKDDSEPPLKECGSHRKPCTESEMRMLSEDEADCRRSEDLTESPPELSRAEVVEEQATKSEDQIEVDSPALDFTVRKSRIAVKNPRIRPPTNHRSLLHMPSADPTPSQHMPVKVLAGVPLGGLGIGIKLPGLGAGLPVLKKTQWVVRNEDGHEAHPQEAQKKEEGKCDAPKQDEAQHKPRWMPPGHPGFGNPLMSELKSKLKKTPKE